MGHKLLSLAPNSPARVDMLFANRKKDPNFGPFYFTVNNKEFRGDACLNTTKASNSVTRHDKIALQTQNKKNHVGCIDSRLYETITHVNLDEIM